MRILNCLGAALGIFGMLMVVLSLEACMFGIVSCEEAGALGFLGLTLVADGIILTNEKKPKRHRRNW